MDILKKLISILGIILLLFISYKFIDVTKLKIILKKIDFKFFILSLLSTFFLVFFKILRMYKVIVKNGIILNKLSFFKTYSFFLLLALFTNLLFTESSAAITTMQKQKEKIKIGNIFFFLNLLDFTVIILYFLISITFNYSFITNKIILKFSFKKISFLIMLVLIVAVIIFSLKSYLQKIVNLLKVVFNEMKEAIIKSKHLILNYTILVQIFYLLCCYFEVKTFNLNLNLSYILLIYSISSIITIIPISINGLGTREAVMMLLVKLKNYPPEAGFSVSLLGFMILPLVTLFSIYIFTTILGFLKK